MLDDHPGRYDCCHVESRVGSTVSADKILQQPAVELESPALAGSLTMFTNMSHSCHIPVWQMLGLRNDAYR